MITTLRVLHQPLQSAKTSAAAPFPVTGGDAVQLRRGVLGVALVQGGDGRHAYLIGGLVSDNVLRTAAADLLRTPPPASAAATTSVERPSACRACSSGCSEETSPP
jgi:dihydroxyacetone kinase